MYEAYRNVYCIVNVNSLPPAQNGRHFGTFKCIFLNENDRIPIKISLTFVPRSPIGNKPALVCVICFIVSCLSRRKNHDTKSPVWNKWLGFLLERKRSKIIHLKPGKNQVAQLWNPIHVMYPFGSMIWAAVSISILRQMADILQTTFSNFLEWKYMNFD